MANIYLKVPTYVAQFYRGRDADNRLTEFDPVEFSEFEHESVMIGYGLMLIPEPQQTNTACYSQRAWKNILSGKPPTGGKRLIVRDPEVWPTAQEICTLTGDKKIQRMDGYDYLCIAMPREIYRGKQVRQTNGSYSLPFKEANTIASMLRNNFMHLFLDWFVQERRWCNKNGVWRDIGTVIEHFFDRYQIQIGGDRKERDTMRRLAYRWIDHTKMLPNDRIQFDWDDLFSLDPKEEEAAKDFLEELDNNGKNKT